MAIVTTADLTATAPVAPDKQEDTGSETQTLTTEATPKPEDETLSPKFAALARKEKALRQKMRDIEEREKQLAIKATQQNPPDHSWKDKISQDFWGTMTDAGLTPDQITQIMLNQPGPQDLHLRTLQQKITELEAQQKQSLTKQQDDALAQREQAKKQILTDVSKLTSTGEEFELIKSQSAEQAVVDLIEKTFDEEGYIMDLDEAARSVEEYLFEQALSLTKLKKIQSKLTPPAPEAEAQKPQPPPQKQPIQTLSNRIVQSPASKPMNDRERRDRAVKAFLGQLA